MQASVEDFLRSLPQLTLAIEKAIENKNPNDLKIAAHTLKGAVSNFYAEPSRQLAWQLEQLGHSQKLDGAKDILSNLKTELKALEFALLQLTKKTNAA